MVGTHGYNQSSSDRAEPMDISTAEEEAEFQAAEQYRNILRCFMCGSTKHLRPACPLRKQRPQRQGRYATAPNQKSGTERENVNTQ